MKNEIEHRQLIQDEDSASILKEIQAVDAANASAIQNQIQDFNNLQDAKNRLQTFISELQDVRRNQIRKDILLHCDLKSKGKKGFPSVISEDAIVRLVRLRIQKIIKNKRLKKNWSQEDVKILLWIISKYCDKHRIIHVETDINIQDWEFISSLIPGSTAQSCMFKWLSLKKTNLSLNNWEDNQSNILKKIIQEEVINDTTEKTENYDWKAISQKLYMLNRTENKIFRTSKQCRQHWNCYLNPHLKKGPWKLEQDVQLLKFVKQNHGLKKWSEIVKSFNGRTQNALKNRYTLLIQKQKKISKSKNELGLISDFLQRADTSQKAQNNERIDNSFQPSFSSQIKIQQFEQKENKSSNDFHKISQKIPTEPTLTSFSPYKQRITPVRVELFKFTQTDLANQKEMFRFIQHGVMSNGVFEKKTLPILDFLRTNESSF